MKLPFRNKIIFIHCFGFFISLCDQSKFKTEFSAPRIPKQEFGKEKTHFGRELKYNIKQISLFFMEALVYPDYSVSIYFKFWLENMRNLFDVCLDFMLF